MLNVAPAESERLFTWRPNPGPQTKFLASKAYEVLYGGAAGGGKSESLLIAPLRWVHLGAFRAILFRRTFPELEKSLVDRSRHLYPAVVPGAKYNGQDKVWRFPSGAVIYFGHLEHETSVHAHQSAEYQFIGFDEVTHFTENQYTYMLTRARSSGGLPVRIRCASNPGGPGHEWVFKRWAPWLDPESTVTAEPCEKLTYINTEDGIEYVPNGTVGALSKTFIPALLTDNPHLTKNDPEYEQRIMGRDRVTRAQLLRGDWLIRPSAGAYFKREWFKFVDVAPMSASQRVRAWDLASTVDGDWTVGVRMARHGDGRLIVEDVQRLRARPAGVQKLVTETAANDPEGTRIVIPQDPGQAGVDQIDNYARLLIGRDCRFRRVHGDKETRAQPISAQSEAGSVTLVKAKWNEPFLQALEAFPEEGMHDDDVDALADAFNEIANVMTLGAAPVVSGTRRGSEAPEDEDEDSQWQRR